MPNLLHHISNLKVTYSLVNGLMRLTKKVVPYKTNNPFLESIFAPVERESFSTKIRVTGEIPKELNGLLLRTGPNPIKVDNPALYSWFVGDGMVHALKIENGQAQWYKSKYVQTHKVSKLLGIGKIRGQQRGVVDLSNTNIIGHAGKIWSLIEAGPYPISMDFELNSEAYGLFNSNDQFGFTAHPHKDPETGDLHGICYDSINLTQVFYQVIDPNGQVKKRVEIPVKHGPMMHDCAMSSTRMVIFDMPITFSFKNIARGAEFPYAWNDKHTPRIGLLPKDGHAEDIRWFTIDPCFVFHTCNAFDLDNGDLVVDVAVHGKSFQKSIQGPADEQHIKFERWTLQSATGNIKREVISDIPQDFPRFDERMSGKNYRYAYAVSVGEAGKPADPIHLKPNLLLRHDLKTGKTIQHSYGNALTGEVIFVPKNANSAEDDGWLMSYVHDLENGPSKIVILDSKKIGQEPQAIIEFGVRVPIGFHTNWVDYPAR